VLEELRKFGSHPTAVELFEIVRTRLPNISLGTVYRNLDLLVQSGEARKLEFSGAKARFDGRPGLHYHIRCVRCQRVDDVHDLPPGFAVGQVRQLSGYEVLGCRLEFFGICPECKTRAGSTPGETTVEGEYSGGKESTRAAPSAVGDGGRDVGAGS
jgi:Fur family ferric uptake transcriptional regulator